ncbi:MAG: histidine triad nucleotide-binding protein [Buchnera aphidicola (Eriosoma harunire)]
MSNQTTIFHKIITGEIKSNILYQDQYVIVINDIQPQAPIHILIIPKQHIPTANQVNQSNKKIVGHMFYIATKIAKMKNIDQSGYRIILNCNKHAGQEISYLHLHLLGGAPLGPNISNKI